MRVQGRLPKARQCTGVVSRRGFECCRSHCTTSDLERSRRSIPPIQMQSLEVVGAVYHQLLCCFCRESRLTTSELLVSSITRSCSKRLSTRHLIASLAVSAFEAVTCQSLSKSNLRVMGLPLVGSRTLVLDISSNAQVATAGLTPLAAIPGQQARTPFFGRTPCA